MNPLVQKYAEKEWYYVLDTERMVATDWYSTPEEAEKAYEEGNVHDIPFPASVGDMRFVD